MTGLLETPRAEPVPGAAEDFDRHRFVTDLLAYLLPPSFPALSPAARLRASASPLAIASAAWPEARP